MKINEDTKIASLLKYDPRALEAIISISAKFNKLRNPFLRKLLAGRTSIYMASKIGNCNSADFFAKLLPLGFQVDTAKNVKQEIVGSPPEFLSKVAPECVQELDVRPLLAEGRDPLKIIMKHLKSLHPGHILKLINTFEPTPLIALVARQGYRAYTKTLGPEEMETYLYRDEFAQQAVEVDFNPENNWESVFTRFKSQMVTVDVRSLPMPQPMMTILEALDSLAPGEALFVLHKKIPVFLFPELREKGFGYTTREIAENEVHLLIFKAYNDSREV